MVRGARTVIHRSRYETRSFQVSRGAPCTFFGVTLYTPQSKLLFRKESSKKSRTRGRLYRASWNDLNILDVEIWFFDSREIKILILSFF